MGVLDLWSDGHRAMSELGHALDADAGETPVPACPGWTVREVFAHQAGVAADVLAGRMEGAATDSWTSRQVAERADRSLSEVLDEWDAAALHLLAALRPFEDQLDQRLVMDVWHHTQDVRGALDLPGETGDPLSTWVASQSHDFLAHTTGLEVVLADPAHGPTPGSLTVPAFEAARGVVGRRSAGQIRAWSWGVDADEADDLAARVPVFGPRPDPLVEAFA